MEVPTHSTPQRIFRFWSHPRLKSTPQTRDIWASRQSERLGRWCKQSRTKLRCLALRPGSSEAWDGRFAGRALEDFLPVEKEGKADFGVWGWDEGNANWNIECKDTPKYHCTQSSLEVIDKTKRKRRNCPKWPQCCDHKRSLSQVGTKKQRIWRIGNGNKSTQRRSCNIEWNSFHFARLTEDYIRQTEIETCKSGESGITNNRS